MDPKHYGFGLSKDDTLLSTTIHGTYTYSTTAGGVLAQGMVLDPNALNNNDFADFSSTYDEFRVMGAKVTITNVSPNANNLNSLVAVAFDNDSAGTPSSYSSVRQYSTCRLTNALITGQPSSFIWWRPTRGKETNIPWVDVAAPSGSVGSMPFYGDGLTASTAYWYIAVELFIQFRGRR